MKKIILSLFVVLALFIGGVKGASKAEAYYSYTYSDRGNGYTDYYSSNGGGYSIYNRGNGFYNVYYSNGYSGQIYDNGFGRVTYEDYNDY
jgi:hypothetical protein